MAKNNPPDPLTKAKLLAAELIAQRTGIPLAQAYADIEAGLARVEREQLDATDKSRLDSMLDTEVRHESHADSHVQTFGAPVVTRRKG